MSFIRKLLDFLYPPKCAFCRKLVPADADGICPECKKNLPFTKSGDQVHGNFFTVCVAPLYYEDEVRDALLRYKFEKGCQYSAAIQNRKCRKEKGKHFRSLYCSGKSEFRRFNHFID